MDLFRGSGEDIKFAALIIDCFFFLCYITHMGYTQTIEIPVNRRIFLDLPPEVPVGRAQVEVKVFPFAKKEENHTAPLKCLVGVSTPRADRLLGAAANLGNITLDEIREERLEKYL